MNKKQVREEIKKAIDAGFHVTVCAPAPTPEKRTRAYKPVNERADNYNGFLQSLGVR
jgi:hypothetical protein